MDEKEFPKAYDPKNWEFAILARWDEAAVRDMVRQILSQIEKLSFNHLGQKTKPPTGY